MNSGKDYNYKRGAWIMKHPPPENKAIFWTKAYTNSFIINKPPPSKNTWDIKTTIWNKTQNSVS